MNEHPELPIASLRRLARGLLYDRDRAEDVVQEAWLAALRSGPRGARLGGWMREAVRRIARSAGREESRRSTRERRAARPEALASAADAAARIEILRGLLDAVDALEEPYRTAIVLRFFDELPPREIARRLGVPVNTARTHVRRGLERLRQRLDGERGRNRQGFLAALAPFAGRMPWLSAHGSPLLLSKWSGALLVKNKVALAVGVVLVLGLSWFVLRSLSGDGERPREVASELQTPWNGPASVAGERSEQELAPHAWGAPLAREPARAPATAADATWIVRGHALREEGEPFPGVRLVGRVHAGPRAAGTPLLEQRFHADENGDFAWAIAPPAELVLVSVEPEAEGHLNRPTQDVFLPGDPAPQSWTVTTRALDCLIRGSVRAPDGRPVAGARVQERDRMQAQETSTDADGRYALAVCAGGERELRVSAAGFAQESIVVDASRPGETQAPDLVLAEELRVRGHVFDEDGAPVAEAVVEPSHPFELVSTTTDASGAFELGTLDPGAEHLAVTARKEGFVTAREELPPDDRTSELELRLVRGVRVTGTVLGPEREPVWGAWVSVGYWNDPPIDAYSDRDGRFLLEHVSPGGRDLWLWRAGYAQTRVDVEIPADAATFEVELQLEEPHFLGGVVLDELGAPLSWAWVYVDEPFHRGPDRIAGFHTHAGADGRFRFDGLPDIDVVVGALAPDRARLEQEVTELDRDDLVLQPARAAGLAGRVVDAESGVPITAFSVRVGFPPPQYQARAVDGFSADWSRGVSFTDAAGEWRLDWEVEPDKVASLTVEAPGYAPSTVDVATTAVDADPSALVVRMVRGTLVRGRVVEKASGAPVAGARVRRFTARVPLRSLEHSDEPLFEATTDAAGRFELANVPTGEMSLGVDQPQWSVALDGPFPVDGSAPIERWIELGRGGRIAGRLLDAAGNGLAGEPVSAYGLEVPGDQREWSATTAADGSYTLENLPPGTYHVRWERRLGETEAYDLLQLVTLASDEERTIDLQPRGRAIVRGTLEYEGEIPDVVTVLFMPERTVTEEEVKQGHAWARSGRATFAEHGRFELTGLEPGRHSAVASFRLADGSHAMGSSGFFDVPEDGVVEVVVRVETRRR